MPPATRKISYEELAKHFHLPLTDASIQLGVCTTVLKRVCRQYKIKRWPYRKIRSIDHTVEALKGFGDHMENVTTTVKKTRGKLDVGEEINKLEERRTNLVHNPITSPEVAKEQDRDRRKIMKKLSKRLKKEQQLKEKHNSSSQIGPAFHFTTISPSLSPSTSLPNTPPSTPQNSPPNISIIYPSPIPSFSKQIHLNSTNIKPSVPYYRSTHTNQIFSPTIISTSESVPSPSTQKLPIAVAHQFLPALKMNEIKSGEECTSMPMEMELNDIECGKRIDTMPGLTKIEKKLPVLEPSFEKVQMFGCLKKNPMRV